MTDTNASRAQKALEPASDSLPIERSINSIAISLRRIADVLERMEKKEKELKS